MGDSWEDHAELEPSKPAFVPRVEAPAFVPRASAPAFVPGQAFNFAPPPPPPRPAAAQPPPPPPPAVPAETAPMEVEQPVSQTAAEPAEQPQSSPQEAQMEAEPVSSSPGQSPKQSPRQSEPAASGNSDSVSDLTSKTEQLKVSEQPVYDDIPVDESRILEAYKRIMAEDPRDHLNVVFIGHVDAGKSTLGGQILFMTGGVDKRTIEKYEREAKDKNRESWYMAYIMDTNEEERVKGITVEVGRAKFETDKRRYTILDAPGHKNYVPNMIMGAAQVCTT